MGNSSILLFILFGIAVGCGPERTALVSPRPVESENAERIEDLDREISALEESIEDEDPYVEVDLNERIARDRETIASLNMEAAIERATQSDEFRIFQFRQEQTANLLRDRLASLAEKVREEERSLGALQQTFATLVAPEESELMRRARAELSENQTKLESLRAEYESLLAEYNSLPDSFFSDQSRQLESARSRQSTFAVMISETEADLNLALQAKNQRARDRESRTNQLTRLREARARLSTKSTPTRSVAEGGR